MDKNFIQEAFRQVYLTEDAEEFSLNVSGPDDTESFLDVINGEDEELISDVYDLEAEAKEDLKQSYIGKVILDCNVCHSNVFFDKDQITENEDGLCCAEIECPYCMSNEGYTIIGEVKPFEEETEEEPIDVEVEVSEEEPEEDIDVEETEDEEDLEEGLKADEVKELRGDEEINGADGPLAAVDELEGSDEIRGPKYTELNEGCEDKEDRLDEAKKEKTYIVSSDVDGEICKVPTEREAKATINQMKRDDKKLRKGKKVEYSYELKEGCGEEVEEDLSTLGKVAGGIAGAVATKSPTGAIQGAEMGAELGGIADNVFSEGCEDKVEEACKEDLNECGVADPELVESIEDVSITTEDETMTMTTKEDGGVVVETSPKEDEFTEEPISDEEMIAPLEPETEVDIENAIEGNDEEEIDEFEEEEFPEDEEIEEEPEEEFEEFDEESFNGLGESYLKRCYENVTSFKTSNVTLNENKEFIIEGKIGFDSGNEKDTQFIFSTKSNEDGKLKLEGYNKQISNGKKTFKLNCSINDKALVCESLNYNYKGKNDLNESVRVYGTVKRK